MLSTFFPAWTGNFNPYFFSEYHTTSKYIALSSIIHLFVCYCTNHFKVSVLISSLVLLYNPHGLWQVSISKNQKHILAILNHKDTDIHSTTHKSDQEIVYKIPSSHTSITQKYQVMLWWFLQRSLYGGGCLTRTSWQIVLLYPDVF